MTTFLRDVVDYKVPERTPYELDTYFDTPEDTFRFPRSVCTERGMWAIVAMDWTERLADYIGKRYVLEVMAGCGWLASALRNHGCTVVATDSYDWYSDHKKYRLVTDVWRMSALEATRKYADWSDIILCSWPPMGSNHFDKALDVWGHKKTVIFIGESHGCTGSKTFFNYFQSIEVHSIPNWKGMHDRLYIGTWSKPHEVD
jgi:hypothetical protein